MQASGIIYQYCPPAPVSRPAIAVPKHVPAPQNAVLPISRQPTSKFLPILGFILLALGLGGAVAPLIPTIRLETAYAAQQTKTALSNSTQKTPPKADQPRAEIDSLIAPDGTHITPVNENFSVIIPKIGVNAPVIPDVDPNNPGEYSDALLLGVAQSKTSFTPDQNGTTYLFSHSTNFDWFINEFNAVFYLLKKLTRDDLVVVVYKGKKYTYRITEARVVNPSDISYLVPQFGKKSLILQTCWPPGSTTERLLLFADFVQEK